MTQTNIINQQLKAIAHVHRPSSSTGSSSMTRPATRRTEGRRRAPAGRCVSGWATDPLQTIFIVHYEFIIKNTGVLTWLQKMPAYSVGHKLLLLTTLCDADFECFNK